MSKEHNSIKHDKQTIIVLDLAALAVIMLLELLMPKTRWLNCVLALAYLLYQSQLMFGGLITSDVLYLILYIMTCFGLGTSLSYVMAYLKLTYQGVTTKELRSIELETEKQVLRSGFRDDLGPLLWHHCLEERRATADTLASSL